MLGSALVSACGGGGAAPTGSTAASRDQVVRRAQQVVHEQLTSDAGYLGPRAGPRAQRARTIVFVAADVTNGGIAGVATGVQQASSVIGWRLRVLDGRASVAGRARALSEAIALRPSGIILGGFDASEQRTEMKHAEARHIPVVGWHAGPRPGPDPSAGLFTNVTTDPLTVARLAAMYVIARSGGRAGVVIFYDSEYAISVAKARAMRAEVERCKGCSVLSVVNTPIAQAEERMPSIVSSLLQKYGRRLTYMLAVNGNYYAGSRAALFDLGRKGTDPPFAVAAGDGDASEFERIRSGDYQTASVAEPLYLQGWQMVDELNRALAHAAPSGYVAPPRLITRSAVPRGGVFDPPTPYRANYRRIWGI